MYISGSCRVLPEAANNVYNMHGVLMSGTETLTSPLQMLKGSVCDVRHLMGHSGSSYVNNTCCAKFQAAADGTASLVVLTFKPTWVTLFMQQHVICMLIAIWTPWG